MGRGGDVGSFGGKVTVAVTASTLFSLAWTRAAQAAQVMPVMTSSTSVTSGAAVASMLAKVLQTHAT